MTGTINASILNTVKGGVGSIPTRPAIREEGVGMNSAELQVLIQYLEALRREQKKTSDIVTGVGVILIIVFSLSVFGWHPWV